MWSGFQGYFEGVLVALGVGTGLGVAVGGGATVGVGVGAPGGSGVAVGAGVEVGAPGRGVVPACGVFGVVPGVAPLLPPPPVVFGPEGELLLFDAGGAACTSQLKGL